MDWYYEQMETARPITEEVLAQLKNKCFNSGRPINVGDVIFTGLLLSTETESPTAELTELNIKLIFFHKDEINKIYKTLDKDDRFGFTSPFPTLKLIG
jgi:hypothetical protein